jgi:predicted DNA-binding transcriptional regulator AlpA
MSDKFSTGQSCDLDRLRADLANRMADLLIDISHLMAAKPITAPPLSLEYQQTAATSNLDRWLSIKDVIAITSFSRAHIYRLAANGAFPQPQKRGTRSVWPESAVRIYLESFKAA